METDRRDGHILIVGGGGTGGALAHDLSLRGLRVTLVERGELTSGTTGRHHGMLHSGGRYAVGDRESAVECMRREHDPPAHLPRKLRVERRPVHRGRRRGHGVSRATARGLRSHGIPARQQHPAKLNLNPELKAAVRGIRAGAALLRHRTQDARRDHRTPRSRPSSCTIIAWAARSSTTTSPAMRRNPRRHRHQRRRAVHGRGHRQHQHDPALAGRAARPARPPLQHGDQPHAQVR